MVPCHWRTSRGSSLKAMNVRCLTAPGKDFLTVPVGEKTAKQNAQESQRWYSPPVIPRLHESLYWLLVSRYEKQATTCRPFTYLAPRPPCYVCRFAPRWIRCLCVGFAFGNRHCQKFQAPR